MSSPPTAPSPRRAGSRRPDRPPSPDRIETDPAHRRRGLGSNVMLTLEAAAAQAGAGTGVLAATVDGLALYDSLGWRHRGPLTGIVRDTV
ncbi:GNAT family N-acetyltransferase [Streptomyces sp. NPDC093249]|uniref:GNAT family N-acetyltransferase n=1 Tax=unclassified Streptomyces TaxID=2593676 RepID=UPI0037F34071